jgi:hypothetical protein
MRVEPRTQRPLREEFDFKIPDKTPLAIATELFRHLSQTYDGIEVVNFTPGFMDTKGTSHGPILMNGGWSPPSFLPQEPYREVLDWQGILTGLNFTKESTMIDGSMPFLNLRLEDKGSMQILNNKLDFASPYQVRNGSIYLSLDGYIPNDIFQRDPETFEPTVARGHIYGNLGPLLQTTREYLLTIRNNQR